MAEYTIALYMRLSLEDEKTDSLSIPNQRLILREKAMSLPEWRNAEILEFVDNGHTGTNFERPAVQQLLNLVRDGKINCIIVKDFSRFGRNSIETGYFIEKVFPIYHIRFISISDCFDTNDHKGDTGGIDVAFKYLINECYSRDMSMKSRSAKYARFKRGEYQSVICPYGYQKSEDGRMKPDEETADNVRMIFKWAADGVSAGEIVRKLYELNIPTPAEHKANKGKNYHDISRTNGVWSRSTVLRILGDERYTGVYVIGKRTVKEIGGTRMKLKDESEWIKIPDHHTPIISKELYEEANEKLKRFTITKGNNDYLLKGKVFCGCCDHAMSFTNKRNFSCVFSKAAKEFDCHDLKISAKTLQQAVFDTLRLQIGCVLGTADILNETSIRSAELQEHEQKIQQLQDSKRQLYEQYVTGELDVESYKTKKAELEVQLTLEKNICSSAAAQAKSAQCEYETVVKRNEIIKELDIADTLTKALDELLIERVYVFPDNRIEIVYKTRSIF